VRSWKNDKKDTFITNIDKDKLDIILNKLNVMQNTNDINNTIINIIVNEIGTLFQNSAQASFSAKQVHAYSKPVSNKNKHFQ